MEEENPESTSLEDQLSLEENYYEFKYGLTSEFFENILNHEENYNFCIIVFHADWSCIRKRRHERKR